MIPFLWKTDWRCFLRCPLHIKISCRNKFYKQIGFFIKLFNFIFIFSIKQRKKKVRELNFRHFKVIHIMLVLSCFKREKYFTASKDNKYILDKYKKLLTINAVSMKLSTLFLRFQTFLARKEIFFLNPKLQRINLS